MSKKRYFDTKFWSDSWIVDELNPLDRYLFMYLMLNEKTNIIGIYELSLRTASNETGIEREELVRMMKRLEPKVFYRDGWVILPNTIKHQNYRSPLMVRGIEAELRRNAVDHISLLNMPQDFDYSQGSEGFKDFMASYGIDTVYIPRGNRDLNRDIDLNRDLNINTDSSAALSKSKAAPGRIPTEKIEAMMEYWERQIGYKVGNELSNRRAIAALLRTYDQAALERLVDGVKQSHEDQYAPRISDFVSLKRKVNDLLVWGRKRSKQTSKVVDV